MDDTAMSNPARLKKPAIKEAPDDARIKKVQRLQQLIASGTYDVSSEALADRLIEHMRELGEEEFPKRA